MFLTNALCPVLPGFERTPNKWLFFFLTYPNAGFRLACRFAAVPRDHRLLFQSCSSQRQRHFGFYHRAASLPSWIDSTVCDLPRWAKGQGYRSIGLTLLAAWSSLCGKWRLRSWIPSSKRQCGKLVWNQHYTHLPLQKKKNIFFLNLKKIEINK